MEFHGISGHMQDMQVTGRTPNGAFNFISNAGEARIDGVELEARMQPSAALELR